MTILEYLQKQDKTMSFPCNGRKQCGKCQVKIKNSELVEANEHDIKYIDETRLDEGYRLACAHPFDEHLIIEFDEKKVDILSESHIKGEIDFFTKEHRLGLFTDIGSTTIVSKLMYLDDGSEIGFEATMNPQVKYGADVISRIKFADENGREVLSTSVHQVIRDQYYTLVHKNQLDRSLVDIAVITGNTTMIHLFNDMDVHSIGRVPFDVPQPDIVVDSLRNIFGFESDAPCYTLPHISAFVGADIVAGAVACNMDHGEKINLLLDMGTNGEIIIMGPDLNICTSTAAGPAFEGGNIECGGPSVEGAIHHVEYNPDTDKFKYRTIFNKPANSICGSGLVSVIAEGIRHGLIDDTGAIVSDETRLYITPQVYVSNKDIREFQLAKAAIQTGVKKMIEQIGDKKLDHFYLSGGFGTVLSFEDLVAIGIIPREYIGIVEAVKNTALAGAKVAALSRDFDRFNQIARESTNLNLADEPDFNDALIDALFFEEV